MSSVRFAGLLCFPILAGIAFAQPAPPPARTALLILNGDYQKLPRLEAPHNDGAVLSAALQKTGFTVHVFENYTLAKLAAAFDKDFVESIKPGSQVLGVLQRLRGPGRR